MGAAKNLPSSVAFSKALAGYKPVSPRHALILKTWRDHSHKGEQGELWRALQSAAVKQGKPPPDPARFIGVVLGCTMPAARLNDHSEHVLDLFEKLKLKITKVVENADYPLDLWQALQRFEITLRELDRSDYKLHAPAAGGRKDQDGSRDRKQFAQRMFRYIRQIILGSSYLADRRPDSENAPSMKDPCGELVKEVTVMINIIFPTADGTEDRTVRQWLSEISPKPTV